MRIFIFSFALLTMFLGSLNAAELSKTVQSTEALQIAQAAKSDAAKSDKEKQKFMSQESFLESLSEPYCSCGIGSCGAYNRDLGRDCSSSQRLCNKCDKLTCESSSSCR